MMKMQEERTNGYTVHSYTDEEIRIAGKNYRQSLILAPDQIVENWSVTDADLLEEEQLQQILELKPEIVLLGTGKQRVMFNTTEKMQLLMLFPGMEMMETAAACRTYNLLAAEGRRVVAGLIIQPK